MCHTATRLEAHREHHSSRGSCLSPTLVTVAWVDPFRGTAPIRSEVNSHGKG